MTRLQFSVHAYNSAVQMRETRCRGTPTDTPHLATNCPFSKIKFYVSFSSERTHIISNDHVHVTAKQRTSHSVLQTANKHALLASFHLAGVRHQTGQYLGNAAHHERLKGRLLSIMDKREGRNDAVRRGELALHTLNLPKSAPDVHPTHVQITDRKEVEGSPSKSHYIP